MFKEAMYFILSVLPFIPAFVVFYHDTDLPAGEARKEEGEETDREWDVL